MFEKDCKYWYKDAFLEVPEGMQHAEYVEKHFSEMFPGKENKFVFHDDPFPYYENYALENGYARIGVTGSQLYFEYTDSFKDAKEFNGKIAENLSDRINSISLEIPNLNTVLSRNDFLNNKYLFESRSFNMNSGKKTIRSSYEEEFEDAFKVYPWDINQIDYHSDEDLGLSAVVEMYGDEFVNVDDSTLNEMRDTLELYFDDDAYVRDWNINNPDDQIESIGDLGMSAEDLDVNDLARYFDYDQYGRTIRLESNMVWDKVHECWVSIQNMDIDPLEEENLVYLSNSRKAIKSSEKWEKDYKHYIPMKTDELVKLFWKTEDEDVKKAIMKALKMRPRNEDKFSVESKFVKSHKVVKSAGGFNEENEKLVGLDIYHNYDQLISDGYDADDVDRVTDKFDKFVENWFTKKYGHVPIEQYHDDDGYNVSFWIPNDDVKNITGSIAWDDDYENGNDVHYVLNPNGSELSFMNFGDDEWNQDLVNDVFGVSNIEIVVYDGKDTISNSRGNNMRKSIKSRRAIKSAESYGWVVESSDANRALDMWIEAVGEEQAYKDVVDTLSSDEIAEAMAYIFRMNDFREWDNEDDDEIESGCHGKSRKKGKKSVKSGIDFDEAEDAADIGYDDFKHGEHDNPFDPDEEPDLYDGWEAGYEKAKKESDF